MILAVAATMPELFEIVKDATTTLQLILSTQE